MTLLRTSVADQEQELDPDPGGPKTCESGFPTLVLGTVTSGSKSISGIIVNRHRVVAFGQ